METCYHLSKAYLFNIIGMFEIPLNKFEKEKRIIELHLAGNYFDILSIYFIELEG
jgi:hypothetical protein